MSSMRSLSPWEVNRMTKRPSILFLATFVALLALIALVLGPARALLPDRGVALEPPDTDADVAAQLDDLITPSSDRAIDWGIFRIIPSNLWGKEIEALKLPTYGPSPLEPRHTKITGIDQARALLSGIVEPAFVPDGFSLTEVRGAITDWGSYAPTQHNVVLLYRHPDGRGIAVTQEARNGRITVENPGVNPRVELRLGTVQGQPTYFQIEGAVTLPGTATTPDTTTVKIYSMRNGLLTGVSGRLLDLTLLRKVADSLRTS